MAASISFRVERPKIQSFDFLKQEKIDTLIQEEKERFCPSSAFLFHLGPHIDDSSPHWWGQILFTQCTESDANLFQEHPHRHTQK